MKRTVLRSGTDSLPSATGVVVEALPNALFRVALEANSQAADDLREVLAYLGGRMRFHRIRVLIGDRVELWLDPYGGKARIIKRL